MDPENLYKHPISTFLGCVISLLLIGAVMHYKPDNEIALTVLGFIPAIWGSLLGKKKSSDE